MKFKIWIAGFGGPERLARALGISAHAVRIWLRGEGTPKAVTIERIGKISRGQISFADIIALRNKKDGVKTK